MLYHRVLKCTPFTGSEPIQLIVCPSFFKFYFKKRQMYKIIKDQAFIFHHYFNYEDSTFRIFFSTNRLINFVTLNDSLNGDATYKLIWNDFPCLIVGTTDKDHYYQQRLCSSSTCLD